MRNVLDQLPKPEQAEAKDLLRNVAYASLEVSAACARLTALWKAGLLGRIQRASPSGGRKYRYNPIR